MQMATDYKSGIVDEARIPYQSTDAVPQARVVLQQLSHLLETAGSSLQHQVKADNYYASRRHFGSREIRHKLMPVGAPPGMALHANRMLVPGALLTIEPIAVVKNSPPKEPLQTNAVALPVAAYSQAVRWGDWVFLAGDMATDFKHALAPEVETDTRTWIQDPIELQTRYTLKKLKTLLEYAGSSLQDVVHARGNGRSREYLGHGTRLEDLAGTSAGAQYRVRQQPHRKLLDRDFCHGTGARIKIASGRDSPDNAPRSLFHEPQALRVGDLLFVYTTRCKRIRPGSSVPLTPVFHFRKLANNKWK